jgi:uncharacterized membrane protein YkvA (DUF1232 family)
MADEKKNWLGPYVPQGNIIREVVQQAKLAYNLILDPRVHPIVKLIPVAAVAYLFLPTDLVPDIIPIVGQVDDLAILMIGLRFFFEFAPPEVVQEHLKRLSQKIRGDWNVDKSPDKPPAGGEIMDGTYREDDK